MEQKRILVVDDEESMLKIIGYALDEAGFRVETAPDAEEAERLLGSFRPDLVVLDVMLPGQSGLEFTKALRETSQVPVILLSAKSEEIDKILGLEFGADDYVTKPFSPRELVSRVRAHLRRADVSAPPAEPTSFGVGDLRVDPASYQVTMSGEPVSVTATEFQILELLARSPGRVFSRSAILDTLWGGGFVGDERAVDVHIHNIREKIEPDPQQPEYLLTVRGVGYRLREA